MMGSADKTSDRCAYQASVAFENDLHPSPSKQHDTVPGNASPAAPALLQGWLSGTVCCLLLSASSVSLACTTGVISGKATVDGRPLLWKNRDAPNKNNQVVHLTDGQYAVTAVVNAGQRNSIWMGVNEVGFCIENSLSRDLTEKGFKGPGNGSFMLRALQTCATVAEFERLLTETNGHRATNANFGVIDASGGAVLFETSPSSFQKFDANDPEVAPKGYVIRSNFAYTGTPDVDPSDPAQVSQIYAGERYLRGCQLIETALANRGVSARYLMQRTTRDLADANGMPVTGSINGTDGPLPERLDTASTISRRTSVSAAVFHGVKPGEDPRLTTMWVMMGEPAFTIAVPCWTATGDVAAPLLGEKTSPLCDAARALRDAFYEEPTNEEDQKEALLDTAMLPRIWERTLPRERRHVREVAAALKQWRKTGFNTDEARALHQQISDETLKQLVRLKKRLAALPTEAQ